MNSDYENNLNEVIGQLNAIDAESLSRTADFGRSGAFTKASLAVQQVKGLLGLIDTSQLRLVPNERIKYLIETLTNFLNLVREIPKFDPKHHSHPDNVKLNIEGNLENIAITIYDQVFPLLGFMNIDPEAGSRIRQAALDVQAQISSEGEKALAVLADQLATAETLIEGLRSQVGQSTAAAQANHFESAAKQFGEAAQRWLLASAAAGVALAAFAFYALHTSLNYDFSKIEAVQGAQLIAAKLLAAGVLAYAASVSVKSFQANRHNQAVNEHRQNALRSFGALVESTNDPSDRSAVLTHAAIAIFAQQDTGFTRVQPSSPDVTSNIVNALPRTLSQTG